MTAPTIDRETEEVIEAVLGGRPLPPGHPGRADALAAMAALGYSTQYMAEQIGVQRQTVCNIAGRLGVRLNPQRGFVDWLAVDFVLQGTPMRLRGHDMDAALPLLAAQGRGTTEIAKLLLANPSTIREHAAALGLDLTEDTGEGAWWVAYVDSRRRKPKETADAA